MTYKTTLTEPEFDVDLEELRDSTLPPSSNEHIEHFLQVEERHQRGEYVGRNSTELGKVVKGMETAYERISQDINQYRMYGESARETLNQLRRLHSRSKLISSPMVSNSYKASCVVKNVQLPTRVLNPGSRK